jgi:hypothetical protein
MLKEIEMLKNHIEEKNQVLMEVQQDIEGEREYEQRRLQELDAENQELRSEIERVSEECNERSIRQAVE